jgi:hypothetical protein
MLKLVAPGFAAIILSTPAVFAQDPPAYPTTEFAEGAKSATVTAEGITATVSHQRRLSADPTMEVPVLTVEVGGRMVREVLGTPSGFEFPVAEASIAEIDPGNETAEVYFSSFTGGAHCCAEVYVVEANGAEWVAVAVGSFDGGGDLLDDADGDGVAEIVTVDNSFLYQFDSYAGSAAPLQILTVEDGEVADVSADSRFRDAHEGWLAEIEGWAPGEDRWTMPGWIAGWVASKIRVGEGEVAWAEFTANWNAANDPGFEICRDGGDAYSCAPARVATVSFPEALGLFLNEHGYEVGALVPSDRGQQRR